MLMQIATNYITQSQFFYSWFFCWLAQPVDLTVRDKKSHLPEIKVLLTLDLWKHQVYINLKVSNALIWAQGDLFVDKPPSHVENYGIIDI